MCFKAFLIALAELLLGQAREMLLLLLPAMFRGLRMH
jgi:hypothetical protein